MGNPESPTAEESDLGSEAKLLPSSIHMAPKDSFHLAYIIHFFLGLGFIFPWNAFITAVDYFHYIYPSKSIDRIFSVAYLSVSLVSLCVIIYFQRKSGAYIRINLGICLFVIALLVVPILDAVYIRGRVGLYGGFDITVVAVALCGTADSLVQGGLIGSAGEMPERYMQAIVAGTAASGVLVSALRLITKASYAQDEAGLRKGANMYFLVGVSVMVISVLLYNVAQRLPVMKYYSNMKMNAFLGDDDAKSFDTNHWKSKLWEVVGSIKWHGIGLFFIYVVTLSIFPGYITEDVHSEILKDWYPIILITGFNVFDLVGKSLTAVHLLDNAKVAIGGSFARVLFYPLFLLSMHGPRFFRTEIPVMILTCLLGLTNGYFTSVLMIMAPKKVALQHAETAGIVMVFFILLGLTCGSIVAWFWII